MGININNVKALFELFSGETADSEWAPVISMAINEVANMLLPDADDTDPRLEFLAASVANYRTQEIKLSSGRSEYEYVGQMNSGGARTALTGAAALMREYVQMCGDLINTSTFVFGTIPPKEE
ncbi:MAG: hypothetical protein MJ079_01670 [Ruminococcus sp.]|nr:hypothetical protein [Ruminococcus sp.]